MIIYAAEDEYISLLTLENAIREAKPDAYLECFEDPIQLLTRARQKCCDVAFMDINMPGMRGLELASALIALNKNVNIIFVTGYDEYALDAYKLWASGYVLKPISGQKIAEQLKNLRNPVVESSKIVARTFGNFTLFMNGEAVHFSRSKSKELLAYLVDRQGANVTRREAAAILWEDGDFDRNQQKQLTLIATALEKDLATVGAQRIFVRTPTDYSVNTKEFDCDLYRYLANPKQEPYYGEYMEQYSWGEVVKGNLK